VIRSIYWSPDHGSKAWADEFLGIAEQRYSFGVREMCCRLGSRSSFRSAADDLCRVGQLKLSHETMRSLVETEAVAAVKAQHSGQIRPDWSAQDCRDTKAGTCVITGADGVKVPLVTEAEKARRRKSRRKCGPRAHRRRRRIKRGSDQAYKEFKLVAFYDPLKEHQYAIGTAGNHKSLGRLMQRAAGWIKLNSADRCYSVTDGADWIKKQYNQRLPMLEANVLDYYHLREHVIAASYRVFGESTPEATRWREEMMGVIMEDGPLVLLDRVGQLRRSLRARSKRKALTKLQNYIAKRVEMLEYPKFLAEDYEIGSGPTEAFCKTLTKRLKGPGMRWDKPNAQGLMALSALRASKIWDLYWSQKRQNAA